MLRLESFSFACATYFASGWFLSRWDSGRIISYLNESVGLSKVLCSKVYLRNLHAFPVFVIVYFHRSKFIGEVSRVFIADVGKYQVE